LEAPALISVVQMAIAVVAVGFRCGHQLLAAPPSQVLRWLAVPAVFAGLLTLSFFTYESIPLPLLTVVRTLTPLVALPLELLVMTPERCPVITWPSFAAMFIMLVGAMVYSGFSITSISFFGFAFAALSTAAAIFDRLLQRRLLTEECRDLGAGVCTIVTNIGGVLPALALAFASHQVQDAGTAEHRAAWSDPRMILLLVVSGFLGIGTCYVGFECQRVISATSFFVMQNFCRAAVVVTGVVLLGDAIGSWTSVLGVLLSLAGSVLYCNEQLTVKPPPPEARLFRGG